MPYKTKVEEKPAVKKDAEKPAAKKDDDKPKATPRKPTAPASEREKHDRERDKFQEDLDDNRQWHRPQEHTFEVEVLGPKGGDAKPIVGGTSAGLLFLDTNGEKRLDSAQVHTLIAELQAAFQAVS